MNDSTESYTGLTKEEVLRYRIEFGSNSLSLSDERVLLRVVIDIVKEPMFILLLIACSIYYSVGLYKEGAIMLISIMIVVGISFFQEYRSRSSIKALKKISASKASVIRNYQKTKINADEIVVNDILLLEEGEIIPADGCLLNSNDFFVNESILTGESFAVPKKINDDNSVFRGTLVTSGTAIIKIKATGNNTMFGKLGMSLQDISIEKTPLQKQIRIFVKYMVWFGVAAFILVVSVNFYYSANFIQSLLKGLTLAMSILPEEIPVAFSTFQALGAYRLLRNNKLIVKQPQYVETLGTATVICADKTGTITENIMTIAAVYDASKKISYESLDKDLIPEELIEYAMWSSEIRPFDPMDKAIHEFYQLKAPHDKRADYLQIHEYPLEGNPPLMTHIFNKENEFIIAAKGAPEAILDRSNLNESEKKIVLNQTMEFAKMGYRVLGIGKSKWHNSSWPASQNEFIYNFLGLIAFHDPPKKNIKQLLRDFDAAGIKFKMITGDYPETAIAIARQIELRNGENILTGKEIIELNNDQLDLKVKNINIFARMFPEAKLKVIESLKRNGEIVAMTGDGVNDAPALKSAHIGIAMGSKGSDVAKSAAAIIITDDDLTHMIDAVAMGRKIYDNLKKAIQYILSIHIPIILIVLLPIFLGTFFNNIFSPIHVIFLELIMGPTCSIIYENEPLEFGTMTRAPRKLEHTFLSFRQLIISIIQGLMITVGCCFAGYIFVFTGRNENEVRSAIFITLLLCNILLTLTNRSFYFSAFNTFKNKNYFVTIIILITLLMIIVIQYIPFAANLFSIEKLSVGNVMLCFLISLVFTWWHEVFKWIKRHNFSQVKS